MTEKDGTIPRSYNLIRPKGTQQKPKGWRTNLINLMYMEFQQYSACN